MSKTMIAAVVTASTLVLNAAYAAPANKGHARSAAGKLSRITEQQARSYARTVSPKRDGWEDRSIFYQGPTYVGRY